MPSATPPAACQLRLLFPLLQETPHDIHSAQITQAHKWLTPSTRPPSSLTTTTSPPRRRLLPPPTQTNVQVRISGCSMASLYQSGHLDSSCTRFQMHHLSKQNNHYPENGNERSPSSLLHPGLPPVQYVFFTSLSGTSLT